MNTVSKTAVVLVEREHVGTEQVHFPDQPSQRVDMSATGCETLPFPYSPMCCTVCLFACVFTGCTAVGGKKGS